MQAVSSLTPLQLLELKLPFMAIVASRRLDRVAPADGICILEME